MMKTKRLFLTMISVCMLLVTVIGSDGSVFAQQPDINAVFEEVLNDDKTESTVTLKITYDTTKFQVNKIIQPDKSEIIPQENTPLITSAYAVKENGNLDFEVKYTDIASKEVKSEKFSYEVKDIHVPVKEAEDSQSDNLSKESTEKSNDEEKITGKVLNPIANTKLNVGDGFWAEGYNWVVSDANTNEVAVKNIYRKIADPTITGGVLDPTPDTELGIPGGGMRISIPSSITYNGIEYKVKQFGSGTSGMSVFGGTAENNIPGQIDGSMIIREIILPDTIEIIGNGALRIQANNKVTKIVLPDSVKQVGPNNFQAMQWLDELILSPNITSYGNLSLMGLIKYKKAFVIPEGSNPLTMGTNNLSEMALVPSVSLPSNLKSIGDKSLTSLKALEKLEIWNTTSMGTTYNFSLNNAKATYLIKSHTAFDKATDSVYNTFANNGVNADNIVYGKTEVKTTSNLTQTLKPGNTTSFVVSTEKSIGNDVVDKTVDFTTDWIDGGYTYSIAGNTSASTVMNGDALTVGSDETANSFTVTATSNFDSSKKVTFTINVDKTKEYVAQAIDYSAPTTNPNGEVVEKFETLQEAFDFNYYRATFCEDNSIVIELLTDITLDETVVMSNKFGWTRFFRGLTTAPTKNHLANNNPSLYTGLSTDGRAILSRGINNKGALIEWTTTLTGREFNFSNIILDGKKSEGLSGDALIVTNEKMDIGGNTSIIVLSNVKLINNNNTLDNGGAIRTKKNTGQKTSVNLINSTIISDCETKYSGGGIYVSQGNIMSDNSIEISNCFAKVNGGAIAIEVGGSYIQVNGRYVNNKANGNGGAVYTETSLTLNSVAGINGSARSITEVTNNSAGLFGSGIYVSSINQARVDDFVIQGGQNTSNKDITRNILSTIIVKDNAEYTSKGNIYIEEKVNMFVICDLSLDSEIGVTLAGVDKNGKNRMEPGAMIGAWNKVINGPIPNGSKNYLYSSNRDGLAAIFRDTNNQSLGYVYSDAGVDISTIYDVPNMFASQELVWPESPMNFKVMDEADSTKLLENAEFKLHQCNDNAHDHSKESNTTLIKDSTCWNVLKTVTSDANGYVDFGDLSTGQYMLALSQSPTGYSKVDGQWFINVNNSPNKEKPQIHTDRLSVINRGDVLPPNLTLTLDSDGYFESGTLLLASEYLISFDAMGGTMSVGEATQTVGLNELIVKPTDPTLAGHGFEGWYTDDSFTTEWNFNTPVNASLTLYAKWDPIVYHVQFDANTGTGTMPDMNYGIGEELTLSKNTFIKIGFEFIGWNTSADGSGASYNDEAVIDSTPASSITLYAQWKAEGPSVYIQIPKAIDLKDDIDGYAKQSDEVKVIKSAGDASWYPEQDIQIRTSTSISLANNKSADTYDVSIFKSDDTQYTDDTTSLMILNVKDEARQSETFTLKTKTDNTKIKNQYHGIMRFIIEFMP